MGDQDRREHFYFDTDELAYSIKEDLVKGKAYRAGRALGVPPGKVEVIDLKTGKSEIVPADATGTRPLNESHPV